MKQSRFFLSFLSFAAVLTAYLVYGYVLVPILLPARQNPEITAPKGTVDGRDRELLATVFKPDSWVLKNDTIGRINISEKGMLLFGKHESVETGQFVLKPVVMMYFPSDATLSPQERYRQAIIMEAVEAVVEFEGALTSGNPQLKSGFLKGNVEIRSDMQNPDASDDLRILTSDVTFDQKMIVTSKPIDFSYGSNRGKGYGMTIELTHSRAEDSFANKMPDAVKRIEISPPLDLSFVLDTQNDGSQSTGQLICKDGRTVIVPSTTNEKEWVVTFQGTVDLYRINPQGSSDKMNCNKLQLTLGPGSEKSGKKEPSHDLFGGSTGSMTVRLIDAVGHPVHLLSPDNKNLDVKCERLTLNPIKNEMQMSQENSGGLVSVTYDSMTLTGRGIYYEFGEDGKIGKLDIEGQGMLQGIVGSAQVYPLQIKWSDGLQVAPDKDQPGLTCIHVRGNLQMDMPNIGSLAADEAFIWCEQGQADKTAKNSQNPLEKNVSLTPKFVKIQKNVRMKMEQGECQVNDLEIWFQEGAIPVAETHLPIDSPIDSNRFEFSGIKQVVMRPNPQQQQPSRTTTATGTTILKGGIFGDGSSDSKSQYTIKADKMQVDARVVGQEIVINQIILVKDVRLEEKQLNATGEEPIHVTGQNVHIRQPGKQNTTVEILGDEKSGWARFKGRGATLIGPNIKINQATNMFWVDGQGRLHLSGINMAKMGDSLGNLVPGTTTGGTTAGTGSATNNEEVIVEWAGKMQFDGMIVDFEKDVNVAYTLGSIQHCDQLQVVLSEKFNFFGGQQNTGIDPKRVIIKGIVDLDHDSYSKENPQKMTSREHIKINSIEINPKTGDFLAYGPGYVSVTFISGDLGSKFSAGLAPGTSATSASGTSANPNPEAMSYLHIEFQESVSGNVNTKRLNFNDRVRCILFPVQSFAEKVNISDTRLITSKGVVLTCDNKLAIVDTSMGGAASNTYTLSAEGNASLETTVQGTIYEGHGERMVFDQAKNIVSMEGGRYTPAVLSKKASLSSMSEKLFEQQRVELNLKTEEIKTQ